MRGCGMSPPPCPHRLCIHVRIPYAYMYEYPTHICPMHICPHICPMHICPMPSCPPPPMHIHLMHMHMHMHMRSYYEPDGGVLSYTPDVPHALVHPLSGMTARGHVALMLHQLRQLRAALALAFTLKRKLVLPPITCTYAHAHLRVEEEAGAATDHMRTHLAPVMLATRASYRWARQAHTCAPILHL